MIAVRYRAKEILYKISCDLCGEAMPKEYRPDDADNAMKREGWVHRELSATLSGCLWKMGDVCCNCQAKEGTA